MLILSLCRIYTINRIINLKLEKYEEVFTSINYCVLFVFVHS
jgi:hypothetical protein